MKTYWTYIYDGEIADDEHVTVEAVKEAADDMFTAHIESAYDDMKNGETFDDDVILVKFYFDDDGEKRSVHSEPYVVEYECYHGNRAEHGTW